MAKETAHLMVAEKQKERREGMPISPPKTHPQWPSIFPLGPTFYGFYYLPILP
jgi:hypothetical protein